MWILSVRTDHVGRRAVARDPASDRHGHRRGDGREYLPVRDVSADPACRARGCAIDDRRTPMRPLLTMSTILGMAAWTCGMAAMTAPQRDESTRSFEPIAAVLSSPRCANCHFAGDVPVIGEHGRFHAMVVRRGKDGRGTPAMRCTNCHQV